MFKMYLLCEFFPLFFFPIYPGYFLKISKSMTWVAFHNKPTSRFWHKPGAIKSFFFSMGDLHKLEVTKSEQTQTRSNAVVAHSIYIACFIWNMKPYWLLW